MSGSQDQQESNPLLDNISAMLNEDPSNAPASSEQTSTTETQPSAEDTEGTTKPAEQPATQQPATDATKSAAVPATDGRQPAKVDTRKLPANTSGDLVDPRSGKVIATAGRERSYFEQARNTTRDLDRMTQDMTLMTRELSAYKQAAVLPTQLGLSPTDVPIALQFMAKYINDPQNAFKDILTDMQTKGYSIEDLGRGTDVAAIKAIMQETIKPFIDDRLAVTTQRDQEAALTQEWDATASRHPWIGVQDEALSKLIGEGMTLQSAALELKVWALERGYDINRSIMHQIADADQQAPQQAPLPVATPPQRENRALSAAPPPVGGDDMPLLPRNGTQTADRASSKNIIRDAMKQYGLSLER